MQTTDLSPVYIRAYLWHGCHKTGPYIRKNGLADFYSIDVKNELELFCIFTHAWTISGGSPSMDKKHLRRLTWISSQM